MDCYYCGRGDRETRPYGPGGASVCYPCATETPERNAIAESAFGVLIEGVRAISPLGIVVIGQESGPAPYMPEDVE